MIINEDDLKYLFYNIDWAYNWIKLYDDINEASNDYRFSWLLYHVSKNLLGSRFLELERFLDSGDSFCLQTHFSSVNFLELEEVIRTVTYWRRCYEKENRKKI